MECINCKEKIKYPKRKFCSARCTNYWWYNHDEDYKQMLNDCNKRWKLEHPMRTKELQKKAMDKYIQTNKFREAMLRNYYKNKDKWASRKSTRNIIYGLYGSKKTEVYIKEACKICENKSRLQIHHEIYPRRKLEIEKAIKDNKIYFLCREHHTKNT